MNNMRYVCDADEKYESYVILLNKHEGFTNWQSWGMCFADEYHESYVLLMNEH